MDTPLLAYPLVAVAPLALHWSSLFGAFLLEPVRTRIPFFDRNYNRWPWLASVLCGLFIAAALAVESVNGTLVYACVLAALICFLVDGIGIAISLYRWVLKR